MLMPSRNDEVSLYELPQVDIKRSIFHKPFGHKTSFNVGQVIPFYLDEVIPGSSHNIKTSVVARLQTLLTPVMDNLYLDTYYFFCPMRLIMDKWKNFCGENENGPWNKSQVKYTIPYLNYPQAVESPTAPKPAGFDPGSLADYFGIPVRVAASDSADSKNKPSALPFRAYALIINEFFRDQNLQQPITIHRDQTVRRGVHVRQDYIDPSTSSLTEFYVTDLELGGAPFVAARYHDYFSSCLPSPQFGSPINIFGFRSGSGLPEAPVFAGDSNDVFPTVGLQGWTISNEDTVKSVYVGSGSSSSGWNLQAKNDPLAGDDYDSWFVPGNLWASLDVPQATITQLRLAFQLQKYQEARARNGNRYREYLAGFFGVSNGDSRMQIPEYLGGHRVPLSIHQVANTGKSASADLGDLGAMSNTSDVHEDFHMSFSEWGYIIGLCVVRYDNTYSQGLNKLWSRRDILDFYNPCFAHISEQPVFGRELCLGFTETPLGFSFDRVFGYLPAWQDYRQMPSRVSGEMRPEISGSLSSWHLADDYDSAPYLSAAWIRCDKTNVDRVLAVSSEVSNQVFCDFYIQNTCVLPMPVHSIPGLADHF